MTERQLSPSRARRPPAIGSERMPPGSTPPHAVWEYSPPTTPTRCTPVHAPAMSPTSIPGASRTAIVCLKRSGYRVFRDAEPKDPTASRNCPPRRSGNIAVPSHTSRPIGSFDSEATTPAAECTPSRSAVSPTDTTSPGLRACRPNAEKTLALSAQPVGPHAVPLTNEAASRSDRNRRSSTTICGGGVDFASWSPHQIPRSPSDQVS